MEISERHGYGEWMAEHRADSELFHVKLRSYLTTHGSWDAIAEYEYHCISQNHSIAVWQSLHPLQDDLIWESFKAWYLTQVCAPDSANTRLAIDLSSRLLESCAGPHNLVSVRQLREIAMPSLTAFARHQPEASAPGAFKDLVRWLLLLADLKANDRTDVRAKLEIIECAFRVVPHSTWQTLLRFSDYRLAEVNTTSAAEVAVYLAPEPEPAALWSLYRSMDLTMPEIAAALQLHLAGRLSDALELPDMSGTLSHS